MTIDKTTWGFSRLSKIDNYYTSTELIQELVRTVSCGGNLLVNVGPRADGTIDAIFQDRLLKLGEWLAINGDAIYKSRPFKIQNDSITSDVWYTTAGNNDVYAIFSNWIESNQIKLSIHNHIDIVNDYKVLLLNSIGGTYLTFKLDNKKNETVIDLNRSDLLKSIKPWVIKFEFIK